MKIKLITLGSLIVCGRFVFADELIATDYSLIDGTYPALALACVASFTEDFDQWFREVGKRNPSDSGKISFSKVSTVEISVPNNGDLGSPDPFILAARKRSASLGANLLKHESGVVNKNTGRIFSETFTAYRVMYGIFPLANSDLAGLSLKAYSKNDVYGIGLNYGYCNGDIILSTDPTYKSLGSDVYYMRNGRYYKPGCILNGKRIEDIAAAATTSLDLLQKIGFIPSTECQTELNQSGTPGA